MKTVFVRSLWFGVALLLWPLSAVHAQTNLLLNPGFRFAGDGSTNASPSAQHWQTWGEASRENWGSADGDGWLATLHGWSGTNYGGWYQDCAAVTGRWYVLSGQFLGATNYTYTSITLKMEFFDAGLSLLAAHTTLVSGVGADWTYYEVEAIAPSNAAWVRAAAGVEGQGLSGVLLLDDFKLTERVRPLRAKLEPERGVLTGVNLDWAALSAGPFNSLTEWDHIVFVDFTQFPNPGGYGALDGHIGQVRAVKGIYMITLEPTSGLSAINASNSAVFAGWCAYWNAQGVPIMVRFAHEMNGDWYPWGMRPQLYREKFRQVASVIQATATNTVMIWAPNNAGSYPFGVYNGMTKATYTNGYGSLADWVLLDSNNDGVLSNPGDLRDDPYAPFYPGDQYVDWVGMTIYHWGQAYPWWYNCTPEARKFSDQLTGNYAGPNGTNTWNPDFYAEWSEGRDKPMIVAETAGYYRPNAPTPPDPYWPPGQTTNEFEIKQLWLEQVYNIYGDNTNALDISAHFPRIKAINWFNQYKIEAEAQYSNVNWTVTSNASVRTAYRDRLRSAQGAYRYFLHASDLRGFVYGWNFSLDGWSPGGPPFAVSLSTNDPAEGYQCMRVDYTAPASPYGMTVAADFGALSDPWVGWASNNAVYLRVKVMPGPSWAAARLILQSASGWDPLATTSCPPDGVWRKLVFPYAWSTHATSAWLNVYLNLDLPTNVNATVYVDAFEVVTDTDLDGSPLGIDEDDDNDGLPDEWELANGLNPRDPSDAQADADGDGVSNYDEYGANTNPTNDLSFLSITSAPLAGASMTIRWQGMPNVQYWLHAAENLQTGPWTTLWGPSNGAGGPMSYQAPVTDLLSRFYRVAAGRVAAGTNVYAPYDARIVQLGRWDNTDPNGPRAEWSAAGLLFQFSGSKADLRMHDTYTWPNPSTPTDGDYLAVSVNGGPFTNVHLSAGEAVYRIVDLPVAGVYTVRVVQRTEALCGKMQFRGLELPNNGTLLAAPALPARRLEVIGDSVTSGYGVEAPSATNTYHPSTVNATLTYGWRAAQSVTADVRLISWSGKGVRRNADGSTVNTMTQLWTRTLPWDSGSAWTFSNWVPQAVVLNIGYNDFAGGGRYEETQFKSAYSNLVRSVTNAYGSPVIFCALNSVFTDSWPAGEAWRSTMRSWLTNLVAGFHAAGITNTFYLEFAQQDWADGYGADYHPNSITHQKMAGVLYTGLVERLGW